VASIDEVDELDVEEACVVAPAPVLLLALVALVLPVLLPACEPHAAAIAKSATVPSFVLSR
jgi:hypothetical protein